MKPQPKNKTLDSVLGNIIQESVKSVMQRRLLQEKEIPNVNVTSKGKESKIPEQPKQSPQSSEEDEKMKKGDVEAKDIVEKLNSIRAGKSFKDKYIADSLEKYVNDMTPAEKTALFAFLKGISQIVTGEINPEVAVEPADKPADVEMKKTSSAEPKPIKATVRQDKQASKPGGEDTSGPVPIKPKSK